MKHYISGILAAILLLSPCKGFGETPSPEQITEWRGEAAQGNAQAQYNLGFMYKHGNGVKQDYAEALRLYRLAAQQGLAAAQEALTRLGAN